MRRTASLLAVFAAALLLSGCGDGGKDLGVTVGPGQGPSTTDYDKQIADIQANTHMPDAAKATAVSRLQAEKAKATAQGR